MKATHKLGIIHRDIKPQNIILNPEGVVKILDFGVAKLTRGTNVTKEFATVGTVHYMSPDQLTGKEIDQRTDIWSLGVVLYEMLTANLPFKQDSMQSIMYSIVNDNPLPPSELSDDVPRPLERIILRCLRKEQEDRYQSVEFLLKDLKKILDGLRKDSQELKIKKKASLRKEKERRTATVISAEISGYGEMMETLDAEEVATTMSDYSDMFTAAAAKYEGTLDKTSGSTFTVLFGVPLAVENGPVKAVQAAVEMRRQLEQYLRRRKLEVPLNIRIGVNTGVVIAGVMGKDEEKYSVIGDAVNLANQLKDAAPKGKIYIGAQTQKTTKNNFEYKELKPITPKGKKQPITAYEFLSVKSKSDQARKGAERMIFAGMVGRDRELDKLQLHLLKLVNGEGSIINIIGEAGIGKSRLIGELRAKDAFKRVKLLEGRALSMGKNLSFHPLIAIIKNWAQITEKDTAQEAYNKLEKTVKDVYPEAVGEIFPFIATLMGMKLSGQYAERLEGIEGDALEKLMKKNFRELIMKAAEQQPLVFLIEDLHWADISSIELLESLSRLVKESSILFINIFRPGYEETGERLLLTIKERYPGLHAEIYLKSLDESETKKLIVGLLKVKGLPANILGLIIKRTGGNPFFIEEIIRSFIDDGIVELKNGHFKVTDKIENVVIPETINDVLMGRIDKLEDDTRSLLKVAAVIGRNFFYKVLARVALNIDEIDERIEFLKDTELIRERTRMDELEYVFKNTLIQEAAYSSILMKKRKELHGKVATAIEGAFSEKLREFYGMLALHYSMAEDLEKAEKYLTKAGEEALKAAASSEALHFYREALSLYLKQHKDGGDPDTVANFEKNIAAALYNKGAMKESVEHCNKALRLLGEKLPANKFVESVKLALDLFKLLKGLYFPPKKPKINMVPRVNDIIELTIFRGTAQATFDNYRMFMSNVETLARLHKLDLSKIPKALPLYLQASLLFSFMGWFNVGKKILDYHKVKKYVGTGHPRAIFDYRYADIMHGFLSGDWREELDHGDEGVVDICLKQGDTFSALVYLLWRGIFMEEKGNFESAKKCSDQLLEMSEVYESDYPTAVAYIVSSRSKLKRRQISDALADTESSYFYSDSVDQHLMCLNSKGLRANVQILSGDIEGAEKSLEEAGEIASREKMIVAWHISSFRLSSFLLDLYYLKKNIEMDDKPYIKKYSKAAARTGNLALKNVAHYAANRTEVYRQMGNYSWLLGKQAKAFSWYTKSGAAGEKMGARTELARTYREIGNRLQEDGCKIGHLNNLDSEQYLKKARAMYDAIGLVWELDSHPVV